MKTKDSKLKPRAPNNEELELLVITEGLKKDATPTELLKATRALAQYGFVPKGILKAKRKTGPKSKSSINKTEDEIWVRLEWIRLILPPHARVLPRDKLLSLIVGMLEKFNTVLLISNEQMGEIRKYGNVNAHSCAVSEIRKYFDDGGAIAGLKGGAIPSESKLMSWFKNLSALSGQIDDLKEFEWSQEKEWSSFVDIEACKSMDQNDAYNAIGWALEWNTDEMSVEECESQIHELESNKPSESGDTWTWESQINSLKFRVSQKRLRRKLSRNELLGASIGMLLHMRNLFYSSTMVEVNQDLIDFRNFIRCVSFAYDPSSCPLFPSSLGKLDQIFSNTEKRQLRTPFYPIFDEERDMDLPVIPSDGTDVRIEIKAEK